MTKTTYHLLMALALAVQWPGRVASGGLVWLAEWVSRKGNPKWTG